MAEVGFTYVNWMQVSLHLICMTSECNQLSREPVHTGPGAAAVRIAEGSCASLGLVQVQVQAKIWDRER